MLAVIFVGLARYYLRELCYVSKARTDSHRLPEREKDIKKHRYPYMVPATPLGLNHREDASRDGMSFKAAYIYH